MHWVLQSNLCAEEGGQRLVVVVRCPGCSTVSEAHSQQQGKYSTIHTNTVLECPAGCAPAAE